MSPRVVTESAAARAARLDPLGEVVAAIGFLTRVPVAAPGAGSRARSGAAAFGIVGAALGLLAAAPLLVAAGRHPVVASILGVAILAVLDGGLHLDGVADTFDALAAPAGGAERARTDPRAGIAGVVAIVIVLAVDVAALAEVAARSPVAAAVTLVAAASLSRAVAPAAAVLGRRSRRPPAGLGAWFSGSTPAASAIVAMATALVVTALATELGGVLAALAAGAGAGAAGVLAGGLVAVRGQLDGDGYGALVELTFAATLVSAALLS